MDIGGSEDISKCCELSASPNKPATSITFKIGL